MVVSFPKFRGIVQQQAARSTSEASSVNAQKALSKKLKALQKAQNKGRARNNFGISEQVKPSSAPSPKVQHLIEIIEDHLGPDFKMIKNKNGDPVFINKDNTRRIRFDIHNSHGELPHGHMEYFTGTRWKDSTSTHRIILKDVPELISDNPPKLDK